MQVQRFSILMCGLTLALAQESVHATPTLLPMDEATTLLSSPVSAIPAIAPLQYSFGANPVATLVTANPLLCANTAAATGATPTAIAPVYYSANGSVGTSPLPFVFGAASGSSATSAVAYGATNFLYNGNQVQFGGDPLDALVCYGLDANGVHKLTRDLFADGFEVPGSDGLIGNSTVTVSVFHLPAGAPNNYYGYTVDVNIPSLPANLPANETCGVGALDCDFALVEGYDTSVFEPSQGGWCLASAGAQSCPGQPTPGDINISYLNYGTTTSLTAPVGSAQALQAHFVVLRYFASGVTALPSSGAPVVMAALFSPLDLLENKLDDNVATGNNTLANLAPSVSNDSTLGTALIALQENTDSGTLSFDITDPDTVESSGNLLSATVVLNLPNGIQVPVAADCSTLTSPAGQVPVNRTCTLDIPLNNATYWDASVASQYQGQFNDVATDTTNGTYASGVSAGVQIVVTDSAGKSSAPVSLPMHIFSSKNDAPVVTFDAVQWPSQLDANDNNTYPTYTCSVGSNTCGTPDRGTIEVIPSANFNAPPGPRAAFDELSTQITDLVPYTDPNDSFTNVQCTSEQATPVFVTNGGPIVAPATGSQFGLSFVISATAPAAVVSTLCTVSLIDAMAGSTPPPFPNSESAAAAAQKFRIVVNP